jgi:hypothetical protein
MTNSNDEIVVPVTTEQPPPTGVVNTSTNTGFLTGVQPATQVPHAYVPGQQQPTRTYTEAELEAAKVAERNGVQPVVEAHGQTLQSMEQQIAAMNEEIRISREAREAAETARAEEERQRLDAERLVEEEKLSATELVNKVRGEMQGEFDRLREENASKDAILEQERRFNALQEYRNARLSDPQIAASVMPHLHQYIGGNSEQEIEEAIARAAQTSQAITQEVAEYQQAFRQGAVGVSPASPSVGPMEIQQNQQSMSAEQIAALNPDEYARLRPALLRAAGQAFRQGR